MLCSSGWRPCRARAIPARWLAVGAERGQQKWLRLRLVEHLSAHGGAKELVCVCVTNLCVTNLCVTKMCVCVKEKLHGREMCVKDCVCVTKLCERDVCVCEKKLCAKELCVTKLRAKESV